MNILSSKHGINVAVLGQIGPLHVQDTTGQHGGRGYFPSLGGFFSGRWYCDIGEGMSQQPPSTNWSGVHG